jgi:hypothetical protein
MQNNCINNITIIRTTTHKKTHTEMHTINSIKKKPHENKATILRANKTNTIVIWYTEKQNSKTQEFIRNINFSNTHNDQTNGLQKELRKVINSCNHTINSCNHTIRKEYKWKYVNLNPTAPNIKGLSKIHKDDIPISPTVNRRNAPAHKLAKLLSKLTDIHVSPP